MEKTVHIENTSDDSYAKVLQKIQEEGICPFCEENFLKHHTKPIIFKGEHWILTENFKPYPGTTNHLLIVSRVHVHHFKELPDVALTEFFRIVVPELEKRGIVGGGIFMRFGDTDFTFSSVGHLHGQLVVGVKRDHNTEPLLVPLGNKKKII